MRLPPIPPDRMTREQRTLHDDMAAIVDEKLKGFVSKRADGALVGPFPPMLHFPQFGGPAWEFSKALIEHATLPKRVREVAILATGACFGSRYELYAHERVAAGVGLASSVIAAVSAGQRPHELAADEAVAYDFATALAGGRHLPASAYDAALAAFGRDGVGELAALVGGYCLVSVMLNAFDVPVPDENEDRS